VLKNSPWEGRGFSHVRLSQRLTQDDENKGELIVEASLSCKKDGFRLCRK
jgi:hypothetical protein